MALTVQTLDPVAQQQYEDVWVTVYGFTQTEVPLILQEFAK